MDGAQGPHATHRVPRRHPPAKLGEIAAAIGVVLVGVGVIVGIVLHGPRWHTIVNSWREGLALTPSTMTAA